MRARGVCARCGNFVCDWCTEQGRYAECGACRERGALGFLFTRDAWTVSGLLSHSWVTFKRDWVALVLGLFILGVTLMVLGGAVGLAQLAVLGAQASQTPFALKPLLFSSGVSFVMSLLLTPMLIGYVELCLTALRSRPVAVGTVFAPYARFATVATLVTGLSAIGLVQNLLFSFLFADKNLQQVYTSNWIWWLLAAPLFVYVGTGVGFMYAVLADDPKASALEAVTRSWRIASGKRWYILLVWIISGLATMFGMLFCVLPSIVVIPVVSLLWSGLYLALATPTRA
jgi:hypothetical protein